MAIRSNIPSGPGALVIAGISSTAGEINYTDVTTTGVVEASRAVVVDSSKDAASFRNVTVQNLDAGASGTVGTVDIFPAAAANGKLILSAGNAGAARNTTITTTTMAQASVLTIPDPGAATANFVLSEGTATISGTKTIPTIAGNTTFVGKDIDAGASGDVGTVDIFPATAARGKIALTAANSAGNTTTTIVNASQAGAVTYTIPDAGGAASFLLQGTTSGSVTATVVELNKLDQSVADIYADGLIQPRCAQATWDFAVDGGAISAIDLGITIPTNCIVIGGLYHVQTTCTTAAGDAGTGAIHIEGANDIVTATTVVAGGNVWDQGLHAIIPVWSAATAVKTTAARAITFTIGTQVWTAGKFTVSLFYIPTLVNV